MSKEWLGCSGSALFLPKGWHCGSSSGPRRAGGFQKPPRRGWCHPEHLGNSSPRERESLHQSRGFEHLLSAAVPVLSLRTATNWLLKIAGGAASKAKRVLGQRKKLGMFSELASGNLLSWSSCCCCAAGSSWKTRGKQPQGSVSFYLVTVLLEVVSAGAEAQWCCHQQQATAGGLLLSSWDSTWCLVVVQQPRGSRGGRLPSRSAGWHSSARPERWARAGSVPIPVFFAGGFSAASLPSQRVSVPNVVPPRAAQILGRQQRQCHHDR